MVSPSKTKYSRVAANQQQRTASSNKVKLVKGPRPLIYHRFYLDIQKHQLASKVENTIKELGGRIEFFLVKEITHFITDKDYHHQNQHQQQGQNAAADFNGGPSYNSLQSPATPTTPLTPKTSFASHYLSQQYVNEASPSSPCIGTPSASAGTGTGTTTVSTVHGVSGSEYKSKPRSRADAMLQRVRQQQQQQQQHQQNYHSSNFSASRPGSPCSPAPPSLLATPKAAAIGNQFRIDRDSQSPVQLAKSWGKPIWSTEYAVRYFNKVFESCKADVEALTKESSAANRKATNLQHLRGDFVKIESFKRQHRPAFHLFKKWPVLNLNAKSTGSPFDSIQEKSTAVTAGAGTAAAPAASNKTVKDPTVTPVPESVKTTTTNATAKQQTQQQQQQCGYCEICRIDYDVLANHLVGQEHSAFVNNANNFVALDKLIGEGGVSLETFLSEAQKTAVVEEENVRSELCENDNIVQVKECEVEETIEDCSKPEESKGTEVQKVIRTYTRKSKDKNPSGSAPAASSPSRAAPGLRNYAGRKGPASAATKLNPTSSTPTSSSSFTVAAGAQMFGRRSAIHHHPHNTLNHHNHQKAKAAKLVQQAIINSAISASELATAAAIAKQQEKHHQQQQQQQKKEEELAAEDKHSAPAVVAAEEMKVLSNSSSTNEKEKERQSKRSAADRMGLKGSTIKPEHHSVELMECEGLDPKNTKRISLGLRQNPKRANLNEDFTSLLDETLEPMRKPRIRRESAKRINYSEPREDEIASQEEIMQSIIDSTAIEAGETASGRKKGRAKSVDVKIRGIQWRAPSPQSRPPVKSPLLYKVIEDPKSKSKKNTSPTKESTASGSPSKTNKNGIIVKIRRVRQSELSLLNDEAENFMFPKKDESSDEETDEDRQTTSELASGEYSQEILSSDIEQRNSSMRKSAGTPGPNSRKRTPAPSKLPTDSPSKKSAKIVDRSSATTPVPGGRGGRRGSRGPAALLQDNAEYYKFPDPGSRLRFPEAPIQPDPAVEDNESNTASSSVATASDNNNRSKKRSGGGSRRSTRAVTPAPATVTSKEKQRRRQQQQQEKDVPLTTRSAPGSPCHNHHQQEDGEEEEDELKQELSLPTSCGQIIANKGKEDGMGVFKWSNFNRNCKQIEPYRFAFERVPSLEPWYETFQRQDESCEKMYEYFGNTAYRKLPYEMGPLPALQQNCCILNYRIKSKAPESSIPTTTTNNSSNSSTGSSSNGGSCGVTATTATPATEGTTTTARSPPTTAPISGAAAPNTTDIVIDQSLSLPLKKRKLLIESERPRKSPREHASTLAILGLLQQQQQHNRRRTISACSSIPFITQTSLLRPPSPLYSPKKQEQQQPQQEADSALGDEIRSSCGSDPVTEKEVVEPPESGGSGGASRIKFDPPVIQDSYIDYKMMCQQLEEFLSEKGTCDPMEEDDVFFGLEVPPVAKTVSIGEVGAEAPIKRDLLDIVQACDKEPPLSLKLVSRHESIVRKIVQYDRRPRALSSISIKSFDGGGSGFGIFRKRINRTGWPNAKKRIVTRKQQLLLKVKREEGGENVKMEEGGDELRNSPTEESQNSGSVEQIKVEHEDENEEEEDDEFEDTMTMIDDEDPQGDKIDQLMTEDEEDLVTPKKAVDDRPSTPVPSRMEEVNLLNRSRILPSSKYVTKTTTTMTRVDYNVPLPSPGAITNLNPSSGVSEKQHASSANHHHHHHPHPQQPSTPARTKSEVNCTNSSIAAIIPDDDDKECDSISSRSIFVSDDCDTTSSTLINLCTEDLPSNHPPVSSGVTPISLRSCATPLPTGALQSDEPLDRPGSRVSRISNNSRHPAANAGSRRRRTSSACSKSSTLQPIVCLEKLNCSSMRTRSSSRTPVKTYKRSVFTSALISSSGKPLKKKRKKKHKLNGNSSSASGDTSSPICLLEDDHNPPVTAATTDTARTTTSAGCEGEPDLLDVDPSHISDNPQRRSTKNRPPTPSPIKFSPRKLRKPRGRWYRER
ncbi:protein chiffon-like [Toxorhynchites rutilus septentrionalis]|uniref:protein chiffon-like n=1 Tax=Toxorhynchites rutilus septentrionalis TaxID=329112 RepID=UPI002478E2E6|nr:protein chiffon-like [Toxorhynchites rutilus septentrionalis]XP_055620421.1 protein chiffon-like [Toxorhynchites rutilus septentrionalis]XP_055620422.1 protein chiffon-like [Toxorhynchites rutilus septentrionalis]